MLAKEKNLTRRRDALSTERRNLPMVEIVKDYQFDGPDGRVRLIDIFEDRPQLIIYHFMFHPEWEDGCPSCTAGTDELSRGFTRSLDENAVRHSRLRIVIPVTAGQRPAFDLNSS